MMTSANNLPPYLTLYEKILILTMNYKLAYMKTEQSLKYVFR